MLRKDSLRMKFHVCNIEPQGYPFGHFLDDSCRLFSSALESLGHSCSIGCNRLEPDRMNIIFCGHLLRSPDEVNTVAGACRYIAIQHEVLKEDGVNLTQDTAHYHQVYLPFLRRAHCVWEGTARNKPILDRMNLRSVIFRGGYHPGLEDVRPKRERDLDFLFYGSVTPHRRRMLERLTERGHQVVAIFDHRSTYRNDLIARAKVNLAPIQGPGMEHFAYGRVCYLLNNQSLVVVEKGFDQEWLQDCFISASADNWVDICEQTLSRSDQNEIRAEFCDRFRRLPFVEQMQNLLDQSFDTAGVHSSRPALSPAARLRSSATQTNSPSSH
jgi:hypothetical protein